MRERRKGSALFYTGLLLSCWTVAVGVGTIVLVVTTWRQHAALDYPSVRGEILRNNMELGFALRRGSDLEYFYKVDGVEYKGRRFRYDDHNSAMEWNAMQKSHPRKSTVAVYYNAANPADALLDPGVEGEDLLLLLFAVPAIVVTWMLWRGFAAWAGFKGDATGRMNREHETDDLRFRLVMCEAGPLEAGIYTAAAMAFIGVFPCALAGGFRAPFHFTIAVWDLVFVAGVAGGLVRYFQIRRGYYDFIVDRGSRTVTLPRAGSRQSPVSVPLESVSGVVMLKRVSSGPSGTYASYLPSVVCGDTAANGSVMPLVGWGWSEARAETFCRRLTARAGMPFSGVVEASGPAGA